MNLLLNAFRESLKYNNPIKEGWRRKFFIESLICLFGHNPIDINMDGNIIFSNDIPNLLALALEPTRVSFEEVHKPWSLVLAKNLPEILKSDILRCIESFDPQRITRVEGILPFKIDITQPQTNVIHANVYGNDPKRIIIRTLGNVFTEQNTSRLIPHIYQCAKRFTKDAAIQLALSIGKSCSVALYNKDKLSEKIQYIQDRFEVRERKGCGCGLKFFSPGSYRFICDVQKIQEILELGDKIALDIFRDGWRLFYLEECNPPKTIQSNPQVVFARIERKDTMNELFTRFDRQVLFFALYAPHGYNYKTSIGTRAI